MFFGFCFILFIGFFVSFDDFVFGGLVVVGVLSLVIVILLFLFFLIVGSDKILDVELKIWVLVLLGVVVLDGMLGLIFWRFLLGGILLVFFEKWFGEVNLIGRWEGVLIVDGGVKLMLGRMLLMGVFLFGVGVLCILVNKVVWLVVWGSLVGYWYWIFGGVVFVGLYFLNLVVLMFFLSFDSGWIIFLLRGVRVLWNCWILIFICWLRFLILLNVVL